MVKIRLTRMGNKHRPFYRVVVQKSTAARDSRAIEILGTYNPLTQPSTVKLDNDRVMHWLMTGAQPTETVAILLKKEGILDEYFQKRPKAAEKYKFLDKTTSVMSKKSAVSTSEPKAEAKSEEAPAEEPAPEAEATPAEEPVAEAPAEETPAEEAPAEEEKPAE